MPPATAALAWASGGTPVLAPPGAGAAGQTPPGGWPPPPGGWPPPPAPPSPRPASESRLPARVALAFAAAVLIFDVLFQHLSSRAVADSNRATEYLVRKIIALDVGFYLAVGLALLALIWRTRLDLVFVRRNRLASVAGGLGCGLALGGGLLLVGRIASGHLTTDDRLVLPISEGGALRVGLMLVTTCVLAPLIEETLFRGVLAGSLLPWGIAPAVLFSAMSFAIWHWILVVPTLIYYTLVGSALAGIWRKFGLLGSMSMHAAFNGVIFAAALAVTSGPASTVHVADVSFRLPGGWHQLSNQVTGDHARYTASGPTDSALLITASPAQLGVTPLSLLRGLESTNGSVEGTDPLNQMQVIRGAERHLPSGDAVVADVRIGSQAGQLVAFTTSDGDLWTVLGFVDGSSRAERDWKTVLSSLAWPASTTPGTS